MNRKSARSKANHERWLVSYADFITLLFAFFVVLYAFSKADQKRHAQVSAAIDSAFQSLSIVSAIPITHSSTAENDFTAISSPRYIAVQPEQVKTDLEHIRRDLQKRLSAQISRGMISIQLGPDGLVISLREAGFFDSGAASPRPETGPTLHQIAESLSGTHYDIRVEGHTDSFPIHNSEFESNWELSSLRATHISRMLLTMHTLYPEQLSAAGYAGYHPVATNSTAEGRAENRRVDLVLMSHAVLDLSSSDNAEDKAGWRTITGQ